MKNNVVLLLSTSLILTSFVFILCLIMLAGCSLEQQFGYKYCVAPVPPCEEGLICEEPHIISACDERGRE